MNRGMSKKPHWLLSKNHKLHCFLPSYGGKTGLSRWFVLVYYGQINVAVSLCTKSRSIWWEFKKLQWEIPKKTTVFQMWSGMGASSLNSVSRLDIEHYPRATFFILYVPKNPYARMTYWHISLHFMWFFLSCLEQFIRI